MDNDNHEQRIEHARGYMEKTLKQDTILTIGIIIVAVFSIITLIINGRRTYPEDSTIIWVILVLCIGLLWVAFNKIPRQKRLLQDVEANLEEIERIEATDKKHPQNTKASSNKTYAPTRPLWYYTYGEYGWRKTIPHSEYTKYHIKLEDYETEYEYEDALRKAKNHYDKLHD